jgi:hypothetical protein
MNFMFIPNWKIKGVESKIKVASYRAAAAICAAPNNTKPKLSGLKCSNIQMEVRIQVLNVEAKLTWGAFCGLCVKPVLNN